MATWVVRAYHPSGERVTEYAVEAEADAAVRGLRERGVGFAVGGPALPSLPALEGERVPTHCSFCGKARQEVARFINGPAGANVAICDECVAPCNEIITGR